MGAGFLKGSQTSFDVEEGFLKCNEPDEGQASRLHVRIRSSLSQSES
jgi:hypothetical protein